MADNGTIGYNDAVRIIIIQVKDLERRLASQKAVVDAHKAQLQISQAAVAKTEAEIESCCQTIKILKKSGADVSYDVSLENQDVLYGTATVDDIMGCVTQYDALRKIAELNHEPVDLSEAADLWMASMKSRGSKTSVLTGFRRGIRRSGDWVKISKGVYKLIEDRIEGGGSASIVHPTVLNPSEDPDMD